MTPENALTLLILVMIFSVVLTGVVFFRLMKMSKRWRQRMIDRYELQPRRK